MKGTLSTKILCSLKPLATIRDKIVAQIGGLQPNPAGCNSLWHMQTPPRQGDWSVLLPARCVCACPLCFDKATSDFPAVDRELSWASALYFQRDWYLLRGREGSLRLLLWLQRLPLPRSKQRYWCVATGSVPACMRVQKGRTWKIRVTSTKQKEERDKSSSSLFILIKQDSADTQEVSSPRRGMVMTSSALQCRDEGWRRRVCAPSSSLLSHLHWRRHDMLPAQVQTRSSPLAVCVLAITLEVAVRDPEQGLLCKSTNPLIEPLSPLRTLYPPYLGNTLKGQDGKWNLGRSGCALAD